jgi:hypothetical protein
VLRARGGDWAGQLHTSVPLEDEASDYLAINNARPNARLPRLLFGQLSKKDFRTYVLANLEANRVGAMPILYRLADAPRRATGPVQRRRLLAGAAVGLVTFVAPSRMLRSRFRSRTRGG